MEYLLIGIIAGIMLFVGKLGIFSLIPPRIKRILYKTNIRRIALDLFFGFWGTSAISNIIGQGLTAGIIMITFSFLTMTWLYIGIGKEKLSNLWENKNEYCNVNLNYYPNFTISTIPEYRLEHKKGIRL